MAPAFAFAPSGEKASVAFVFAFAPSGEEASVAFVYSPPGEKPQWAQGGWAVYRPGSAQLTTRVR